MMVGLDASRGGSKAHPASGQAAVRDHRHAVLLSPMAGMLQTETPGTLHVNTVL